jgi:hypothetical protein
MSGQQIFAIGCLIGAVVVAANGHDGWGWFLFVAVLAI